LPVAPPFVAGQWPRRNSIPFSLAHFYECRSRLRDEPHPFMTLLGRGVLKIASALPVAVCPPTIRE
jgi:hypothetical protein